MSLFSAWSQRQARKVVARGQPTRRKESQMIHSMVGNIRMCRLLSGFCVMDCIMLNASESHDCIAHKCQSSGTARSLRLNSYSITGSPHSPLLQDCTIPMTPLVTGHLCPHLKWCTSTDAAHPSALLPVAKDNVQITIRAAWGL